ncbi:MAG: transposase [Actinomycetota bacterium]|nr:transposase [Actinomycetota bacterium]
MPAQAKVGRFQQALMKWLSAQQRQPAAISSLQALLDTFADEYSHWRPHRSLPHLATPATAYATRPKAGPGSRDTDIRDRVRRDRVHTAGTVTLRTGGRLHHIGAGRTYAGTCVLLLVQDLDIRIINAAAGELIRALTIDSSRGYQPTGRSPGPQTNHPEPDAGSGCPRSLETSHVGIAGMRTSIPGTAVISPARDWACGARGPIRF